MEILEYTFMQRALAAGIITGVVCAVVGTFIVLKGLSFMGAGIAHSSFGGVALGILTGINPVITAVIFCLCTGLGIGVISRKGKLKEDTAVGIFFVSTMALGILFIGMMKSYTTDLFGYLFGSILAVTGQDIWIIVILGVVEIIIIGLFYKELFFITYDEEMAEVTGLPAKFLFYLLLSFISLTVVISIKIVGIILVSALLIAPAAAAQQLSEDFKKMMGLSVVFGVTSTTGGLFLSYWLNTASGATIVLLSTFIFFISLAFSPRRRKVKN